jgi:rhamnogalacturonyl hydrolase YesR
MLDDAGATALPFGALYLSEKRPLLKTFINPIGDYIMNRQVRLPDGTFCRPEPEEFTVWADDLFMSVPFLLQLAKATGKRSYYDEATKQAINFKHYLWNKNTGLYRHGWFGTTQTASAVHWGRANGWIAWAAAELLSALPMQHPLYKTVLKNFQEQMRSLLPYQAEDGMWHQVLDNPSSYEETSCTAMFVLALARGVRMGWLPATFAQQAKKGWQAVAAHITPDGIVKGICRGTEIGADQQFYMDRKTMDNDPRGMGAVLVAGIEISKLR